MTNKIKCAIWWIFYVVVFCSFTVMCISFLINLYYRLPSISPYFSSFVSLDKEDYLKSLFFAVIYVVGSFVVIRFLWLIMGSISKAVVKNNPWASVDTIFPEVKH